jgi:hypothetical protein
MNVKAWAIAAVAIVGSTATPASAALQTVNFKGKWRSIAALSTTYSLTDPIAMSVTYDNQAVSVLAPSAYDLVGPGASLNLTIGSQTWTLADFTNTLPNAVIFFAPAWGPDVTFTGTNANGASVITGYSFFSFMAKPGTGLVGETGDPTFIGQHSTFTLSAVPEPANWAMLIAGFGLTGAVLRRLRMTLAA